METERQYNPTKKVYDRAGRLHEVEAEGGTTTYSYYDNGRLEMVEYPDGSTEEYYYYYDNTLNRLVNRKSDGTEIESFSYTYDNANNQISKTDARGTTSYTYDDLERLETVAEPNGKETEYTFDLAGNRGTETVTQSVYDEVYGNPIQTIKITVYDYDSLNRLLSTSTTADGAQTEYVTFTYDDNGNQLTVNRSVYEDVYNQNTFVTINMFDNLNQLTRTETPEGKIIENVYNGEGKRVSKTVDGDERKYLYEADKVILETDGSGNQKARNVQGTNLISRTIDDLTGYYFYNGHGDVTVINDVYGDTILSYYYDAFGNPETVTDSVYGSVYGGGFNNPFLYAGYLWDTETGTYYLMSRYYDPETARFLSEDSFEGQITDPLSLNLYTYCHNEPLMYTDPDGHDEKLDSYINQSYKNDLTLTFVVNQPMPGLRSAINYSDKGDPVGHTFLRIEKWEKNKNGKLTKAVYYKGFYPEKYSMNDVANNATVKGKILDDKNSSWNIAKVYKVSQKQAEKALNYSDKYTKEKYNMITNNCTTFASNTMEKVGLGDPTRAHEWTIPGLYQIIGWAKRVDMSKYIGHDPGDAGQDIKETGTYLKKVKGWFSDWKIEEYKNNKKVKSY